MNSYYQDVYIRQINMLAGGDLGNCKKIEK